MNKDIGEAYLEMRRLLSGNDAIQKSAIETSISYLMKLSEALNNYDTADYSIGSEKDEAICLLCENGYWLVVNRERGNNHVCGRFSNVEEAGEDIVNRVIRGKWARKRVLRRLSGDCNQSGSRKCPVFLGLLSLKLDLLCRKSKMTDEEVDDLISAIRKERKQ